MERSQETKSEYLLNLEDSASGESADEADGAFSLSQSAPLSPTFKHHAISKLCQLAADEWDVASKIRGELFDKFCDRLHEAERDEKELFQRLVREATDPARLCRMYEGWSAWI